MTLFVLFAAVTFVAFTNGANANFKGVASLYGSGTTSLRTAAYWGTATTFLGSLAALVPILFPAVFQASGMLTAFRGQGVVSPTLTTSQGFMASVAVGAALTSFLATRFGFPVSTTHALVGALIGAGLASGSGVDLIPLGKIFLLPLLLSPMVAAVFGGVAYSLLRLARLAPDHRTRTLDVLHFASAGAASFARGLNDTPKMVALVLVVPGVDVPLAFVTVAATIAFGGVVDVRRVAETLGKKITRMNPSQGFAACLVTAALVTTGSAFSLPLSTTHVSVGSLLGMGVVTRQARWRTVWEIMAAWLTTVPCGAVLAAVAYWFLRAI